MSEQPDNLGAWVMDQVLAQGWDGRPLSLAHEIRTFLGSIVDQGTSIDSGSGADGADLWATVGGREYYVHIRPSNNTLKAEGKPIPGGWLPIDTAPVPPRGVLRYGHWRCLLLTKRGVVCTGYAGYAMKPGGKGWRMRWCNDRDKIIEPVAWMPLPIAQEK